MWYQFTAKNKPTLHGWTQNEMVAEDAFERLNKNEPDMGKYRIQVFENPDAAMESRTEIIFDDRKKPSVTSKAPLALVS